MCFCPSFSVDGENAKTEIHPYPRLARLYQELQILGISGSLRTAKLTIYIDNYLAAIPGGLRASQVFQAGIQFRLPIQNKVAEADLGADRAQLQQERLRLKQMEAQAAAEIRNAVT